MLVLLGVLALCFLTALGSQRVQDFFDPTKTRTQAKGSRRVQTPWGPTPTAKTPKHLPSPLEFWNQLHGVVQANPLVAGFIPRDDTVRPLGGWNQRWIPASIAVSAGTPWGPLLGLETPPVRRKRALRPATAGAPAKPHTDDPVC